MPIMTSLPAYVYAIVAWASFCRSSNSTACQRLRRAPAPVEPHPQARNPPPNSIAVFSGVIMSVIVLDCVNAR